MERSQQLNRRPDDRMPERGMPDEDGSCSGRGINLRAMACMQRSPEPDTLGRWVAHKNDLRNGSAELQSGGPRYAVGPESTEEVFRDIRGYIEEAHALTAKNMVLAEKHRSILEDLRHDLQQTRGAGGSHISSELLTNMEKRIRECVFEAVGSMESRLAQSHDHHTPQMTVLQQHSQSESVSFMKDMEQRMHGAVVEAIHSNSNRQHLDNQKTVQPSESAGPSGGFQLQQPHEVAQDHLRQLLGEHSQRIEAQHQSASSSAVESSRMNRELLAAMSDKIDELCMFFSSQPGPARLPHLLPQDQHYTPVDELPVTPVGEEKHHDALHAVEALHGMGKMVAPRTSHGSEGSLALKELDIQPPTTPQRHSTEHGSEHSKHSQEEHHIVPADENDLDSDSGKDDRPRSERFLSSGPFEMFVGLLIVLNTALMCSDAEYRGWHTGVALGLPGYESNNTQSDQFFQVAEITFGIIFSVEVLAKILILQNRFCTAWNIFDLVVVCTAWFEMVADFEFPINPMLLRLARLLRLVKAFKGLSSIELFENLFLMIRGLKAGIPVLLWVVILLLPMLTCNALFMIYMVADFLVDESKPLADRLKCYQYFGTFSNALVTMFEITFANWATVSRFLYHRVNGRFAVYLMMYKLVMGIAVLRVVYGVYLHVTFACATADDAILIAQKKREDSRQDSKLRTFLIRHVFADGHADGDQISREQFIQVFAEPNLKDWLSGILELDVDNADLFFDLLDADKDGALCIDEIVAGSLKLKGTARSMDVLALLRLTNEAIRKIEKVMPTQQLALPVGSTEV